MPVATSSPSRRALLLTGLAAVSAGGASGCDLDPSGDPELERVPPSGVPSGVSEDGDVQLRDQARAEVLVMLDLVEGVRRRYPRQRRRLAGLQALHEAHAALLHDVGPGEEGPDEDGSEDGNVADGPPALTEDGAAAALGRLRAAERSHQRGLAQLAVRAASGSFARLLASMAAGVAAHAAALLEDPT